MLSVTYHLWDSADQIHLSIWRNTFCNFDNLFFLTNFRHQPYTPTMGFLNPTLVADGLPHAPDQPGPLRASPLGLRYSR